jgi:hypothetical protein
VRLTAAYVVGVMLTALVLSGCAASAAEPTTTPTPSVGDGYLCGGLSITQEALDERVPVGSISEAGRIALSTAVWDDGSPLLLPPEEDWYVASITEDQMGVIRDVAVEADLMSGGIAADHEVQTVGWIGDATNLPPGWYGTSRGPCALTVDLGEWRVPAIELDTPPDPSSRELQLLVTEQSCNSGENAEGRVAVVRIDETADQVSLVLGIRPQDGFRTCPSHPATPFTVTLSEPLGARTVLDAGFADPRALWTAP